MSGNQQGKEDCLAEAKIDKTMGGEGRLMIGSEGEHQEEDEGPIDTMVF